MASETKKRLGIVADLLGGLSGRAAKALQDRSNKIEQTLNKAQGLQTRRKKKQKKKTMLDLLMETK